jgi:hypothetical protein
MSLKRIADNESGITYTLEAIIGVLLVIGTILYLTGSMPYTAQKTGQFSKVQLMNIGRDNLDLTVRTAESELKSGGAPIVEYMLKANGNPITYFTKPNSIVNFTVEYRNGQLVNKPMNFKATILYVSKTYNITANITYDSLTNNYSWRVPEQVFPAPNEFYEYNIQAYDNEGIYSNWVTIKVGYYELSTDILSVNGNRIVSGIVTDVNGNGISNLGIRILTYQGGDEFPDPRPPIATTINGTFSFDWLIGCGSPCNKGLYFIQAVNTSNYSEASNMHVIEYVPPGDTLLCGSQNISSSCESITVYEGSYVELYMGGSNNPLVAGNFWVNYIIDNSTGKNGCPSSSCIITTKQSNCQGQNCYNATFNASVPGVYSVFTCSGGCENPWSSAFGSNSFLIYVLPATDKQIGDTCVDGNELNAYMRRYIPAYVNYNLYLIDSKGKGFVKCTNWPVINGYPTAEAVTVSTIAHIEYIPENVNNMLEYRMVLWYK